MRVIKVIATLAVAGIAILPALLWLDHHRETNLPQPSGAFGVGRTVSVFSGQGRELPAWIWYPSEPSPPEHAAGEYLPAPWRTALEQKSGVLLSRFLTRDLSRVRAHAVRDAALSPQMPSWPVVFMRAGLAALTTSYTALAEDLASHGYVVVGFDAPHRSFVVVLADGTVVTRARENDAGLLAGAAQEQLATRLVQAWVADLRFALDRLGELDTNSKFRGRLDLERVGVFGHSLGGAEALQFCHDDSRCKAGIDLDGAPLGSVIADGVTQPFLFLLGDHQSEPDAETRPVQANIRSIYDRLPGDRRWLLTIRGASHYQFSDDGALLKSPLARRVLRSLGLVRLDGRRQLEVTSHYLSAFFDVTLKGAPASQLQARPEYPEVETSH